MSDVNPYRLQWDRYVTGWNHKVLADRPLDKDSWPGDEWGTEERWVAVFETMLLNYGARNWKNCVEIGPGSGKYTNYLLRMSHAHILAFDISSEYLKVMKRRLSQDILEDRLEAILIKAEKASEILDILKEKNLIRKLDAFFSIDAMVHVDLQYLVSYFITAALSLQENGLLIMTLANAVSRDGFQYLVDSARVYYPLQGAVTAKFEFVSPEIVKIVLERIGFQVEFTSPHSEGVEISRDLFVVAKLVDPARAATFQSAIW